MKLFLVKQLNNTLKVAHASDYEKLKKIKVGEEYQCEIKQPRNLKFHRKFFALINLAFENQERYTNQERFRKALIIEAGFYDEWTDLQGLTHIEAKSISFASMKDHEFSELFSKVLDVIVQFIGVTKEDVTECLHEFF